MLEIINKHTVLKQVRTKGEWTGYIAPSNVNSYHVNNGWHIGMDITITFCNDDKSKYIVITGNDNSEELEKFLTRFTFYNCNSELGKRVRFWSVS